MPKYIINTRYIIDAENEIAAVNKFKETKPITETIKALIVDELAAISAYGVAIDNLKTNISDEDVNLLTHILDEEKEHVKELQSILDNYDIEEVE